MAYPIDPPSSAPGDAGGKQPAAFSGGRLSADDFDRLAAAFRPSWEFDDAPFTGPGSLSPSEVHALQGGGTRPDVRAAAGTANGLHTTEAPAPPPAALAPGPTSAPPPATLSRPPAPPLDLSPRPRLVERAAQMQAASMGVAPSPVADLSASFQVASKKPLWVGLGAIGVGVVAIGLWAALGTSSDKAPAPAPVSVETRAQETTPSIPPPPPPETVAVTATPPPSPPAPPAAQPPAPAPHPAPIVAAAPPIPTAAVTSLPIAPPAHPAPAPHPVVVTPAAPKPAPRAKSGSNIVRDVPF